MPLISFFLRENFRFLKRAIINAELIPKIRRMYIIPSGVRESSKLFVATNDAPHKATETIGFQLFLKVNDNSNLLILGYKYKQAI